MNCLHFSVRWNERELFAARIGHVRVPYCIGIQNCLNVAAVRICLRLPRPNVRGLVRGCGVREMGSETLHCELSQHRNGTHTVIG